MSSRLLFSCVLLLASACGDDGQPSPPKNSCRDDGDCRGDTYCTHPVRPLTMDPSCGIGCGQQVACDDDASCPAQAPLCLGYLENCCGPYTPLSTRCEAACTDDATCGEGWRCRADGRGCEAIPCDEGWVCPAHTQCEAERAFSVDGCSAAYGCPEGPEAHGCLRNDCDRDRDCDGDGKCVFGLCYEGFGACMGLVP